MRDHSDDWLKEESSESMRITDLENRVAELETLVDKLQSQLTPRALDLCVACRENPPVPGRSTCSKCVDWSRTSQ